MAWGSWRCSGLWRWLELLHIVLVVCLKVFRTDLEEFGDGLVVVLNGLKVVGGSF